MATQDSYVCDFCSRAFTRKYNLQTHIENCHLNSSCYCTICESKLGSPAGLQLHFSRGHNRFGQPYPECDICGRVFTRKQNIMSHMITVHLQGLGPEIRCNICRKTFTTERNLKRHRNQLHNPDLECPSCDDCHKVFKGKHSLLYHIQAVHRPEKDVRCSICDKLCLNNKNLKRHIELFHGTKETFKCDRCSKVYTSNHSLKRHAKARHNDCIDRCEFRENAESYGGLCKQESSDSVSVSSKTEHVCATCGEGFDEENVLRQHVKLNHSFEAFYEYCKTSLEKQDMHKKKQCLFRCEYCSFTFTSVYELKDHMRMNHDREYCLSTCNVCFNKFYSKEAFLEHKKICFPPEDAHSCSHCDKLFTVISSLHFHTRIFHPQAQVADTDVTSTNIDYPKLSYKCKHCKRVYFNRRSLKHHMKLKHSTDEIVECDLCGKICSNKYYLASHIKIVHNNSAWSKCDFCEKQFKCKRNIRRHIEYTHLGMQRYKCIECETLFKEKRSLRKHVRTKHPNSAVFPQCHICYKRFESAKSCKIHLKLLHSFNMNTYPCDLCSVSFTSNEALNIHLQTKHLAEDEIYKCQECNIVFKGHNKFEQHKELCHINLMPNIKQKVLPRCVLCMKDFAIRKTLRRHIRRFHVDFDVDELVTFGFRRRIFNVECDNCIKNFTDNFYYNVFLELRHLRDTIIFKCEQCKSSYNSLEYSIQRYKFTHFDTCKTEMVLSELCTTQMSDGESAEPESTTSDIKFEPLDMLECEIKSEPMSP